jgi:hypothetical protein
LQIPKQQKHADAAIPLAADTRAKAEATKQKQKLAALKLVKMIMYNIADSFDAESKRQMELISQLNVSVTSRQNDLNEISRGK